MIVIHPQYEMLRTWIEQLPTTFFSQGEIIYDARNQIRIIPAPNGEDVCVKRYHAPFWLNRIIYTYFRPPKAVRAYQNAERLISMGFATPAPIAMILIHQHGLLAESYLITQKSALHRRFYEFREHSIQGYEDVITQFARFSADMHEKQILHKDYSPGNILFDKDAQGRIVFQLVDINRMQFGGPITPRMAAKNFCRLWGKEDFFELLATSYAQARGWDQASFTKMVIHYWKKFWRHRT